MEINFTEFKWIGRNIKYKLKSIANELKLRLRITALEKAEQEDGE
jgi:hypothetical protein